MRRFSGWLHAISPSRELVFDERAFDLAIVFESTVTEALHVPYRIVFGAPGEYADVVSRIRGGESQNVFGPPLLYASRPTVLALGFSISNFAKQLQLQGLISSTLVPKLGAPYKAFSPKLSDSRNEIYPLLTEAGAGTLVIAGCVMSAGITTVFLPFTARKYLADWLQALFEYFQTLNEHRFPVKSLDATKSQWMTAAELKAKAALTEFDAMESARRLANSEARMKLEQAAEEAGRMSAQLRLLLSGTGVELVEACAAVLTELGFQVEDADVLPQHKAAKQEDLRISIDGLVILAEVKGYGKGAKANDLEQLKKAAMVYAMNENSEPNHLWYVVNSFRGVDPDDRPLVLASNSEQVEGFAKVFSGVVVDSRDLYCLIRDVQLGVRSRESARMLLLSAHGRFAYTDERDDPSA